MRTISTPGFWDLHLHGVAGIDFMTASLDEMVHACECLGAHGTGFFAPTLLTAEPALLLEACRRWGEFLERASDGDFLPKGSACPIGLHLEGPFLNPTMAGAHPKTLLRKAGASLAGELIRAARGKIAIVTIAPEIAGATALIRKLVKQGVRVQLGHTVATEKEALKAVRAGATGITHLYNAMRTHHRDPGVLTALRRGLVTAEIITDGVHLDADFVLWCWAAASGHLYAVSDGCSAIGASRGGKPLTLGSIQVERQGLAAVVAGTNILAGGATYLAQHPAILAAMPLADKNERRELLTLFYRTQQKLFPAVKEHASSKHNIFDARSLRFLGCEAGKPLPL